MARGRQAGWKKKAEAKTYHEMVDNRSQRGFVGFCMLLRLSSACNHLHRVYTFRHDWRLTLFRVVDHDFGLLVDVVDVHVQGPYDIHKQLADEDGIR